MAPALPAIEGGRGKDGNSKPPLSTSKSGGGRPAEIATKGNSFSSSKKASPRPGSGGKVQLAPLASPRASPDAGHPDHLDKSADKYLQCVDMLVNGYVQSFVDFFYLTHKSESGGEGPPYSIEDEEGDSEGPLSDLKSVKSNLCRAEAAKRRGDSREVYTAYRSLGRQFEDGEDVKTAIYFYEKCLEVAKLTEDAELEAEANNDLGLAYEKIGNISTAITFHEQHLKISNGEEEEVAASSSPDKAAARAHLVEAYRTFANECEERGDLTQAVDFHTKCLEAAKMAMDVHAEALAHHRLGLALKKLGQITDAIDNQRKYLDMCASNNDGEGQGNACAAIAEALEESGDVQGAIKYLEQFLDVSQNSGHLAQQGNACRRLGAIYNKLGNFNTSVHYFEKNFEIARSIGDRVLIDNARADLGVARGVSMHMHYAGGGLTMPTSPNFTSTILCYCSLLLHTLAFFSA